MTQTFSSSTPGDQPVLQPKGMEIIASTYQMGWDLAFNLMEKYFGIKEVKR